MKRTLSPLLFLMIFSTIVHAQQLSSGIISPSNAMDWTRAGIPSGLPDTNWPICQTINAYSGSGATIQTALANCQSAHSNGGVVVLGAGTFNLSSGGLFPGGQLVVLGQEANATQLNFSGGASGCNGQSGFLCANGDGTYRGQGGTPHVANWTAGYGQGATQITLDNVSAIIAGQSILILNQCDTGFSGSACTTGSPIDNGNYFQCSTPWSAPGVGCNIANESADGASWRSGPAWQQEVVQVTAVNGKVVTISQPLHHPNWAAGQSPQAIVIQPIIQVGVEDLSIDGSAALSVSDGVFYSNSFQSWVSGVKISNVGAHSVAANGGFNDLFQNNYMYGNPTSYGDNAGFYVNTGGNNVIQNNICHKVHICWLNDGPDDGAVFAYNYSVNQYNGTASNDLMGFATVAHSAGDDFQLLEGNAINKTIDDADHGAHLNMTKFRNFIWGWDSCANGQCNAITAKATQVVPFVSGYGTRYSVNVANVLGTPGYHTKYQDTQGFGSGTIWELGAGYGSQPPDPLAISTMLRWGNWDVVNGTTQFNASEVPTSAPVYPIAIPTVGNTGAGQSSFPASFYLSGKPSWFGSIPWPSIGPDVTNGNVGQCAGTLNTAGKFNGLAATNASQCAGSGLNTAWGGHVNANPAMACYLNVLGGNPDGTGSALAFDARTCYGGSSPPPSKPNPPTNLTGVV